MPSKTFYVRQFHFSAVLTYKYYLLVFLFYLVKAFWTTQGW